MFRILVVGGQDLLDQMRAIGAYEIHYENAFARARGWAEAHKCEFDLVIVNAILDGVSPVSFVRWLWQNRKEVPVIASARDEHQDANNEMDSIVYTTRNCAALARQYVEGDVAKKIEHVLNLKPRLLEVFGGDEAAMWEAMGASGAATGSNIWDTATELLEAMSQG